MTREAARLGFSVSQIGAFSSNLFANLVAPLGLTPASAGALRLIAVNDGLSQRELARRLGSVPSRIVVLVDALERAGYVVRELDPVDRRNRRLRITSAGREAMGALRSAAQQQSVELLAPLEPAERAEFGRLVGKLMTGLGLDREVHLGYRDGDPRDGGRA